MATIQERINALSYNNKANNAQVAGARTTSDTGVVGANKSGMTIGERISRLNTKTNLPTVKPEATEADFNNYLKSRGGSVKQPSYLSTLTPNITAEVQEAARNKEAGLRLVSGGEQNKQANTGTKYYSPSDWGSDTGKYATEVDNAAKSYDATDKWVSGAKNRMDEAWKRYETERSDDAYKDYTSAYNVYSRMYGQLDPKREKYNEAVTGYNNYIADQQKRYDEWRGSVRDADTIEAERSSVDAQIKALESEKSQLVPGAGFLRPDESQARNTRYQEIEQQLAQLREQQKLLFEELNWAKNFGYENMRSNQDFGEKSKAEGSKQGDGFLQRMFGNNTAAAYDYINNIGGYRDATQKANEAKHAEGAADASSGFEAYDFMTPEQVSTFNYIYNTQGDKPAQEYLDWLKDNPILGQKSLNVQLGQKIAEGVNNPLQQVGYGLSAGLGQFGTGIRQLFNKQAVATSPVQYAGQQVRENLADTGRKIKIGNQEFSIGQMLYDVAQTGANMAPSIILSAMSGGLGLGAKAASAIGSLSMGLSAGGNAYNQAIKEGKSESEARTYGTLIGAAEGGLQYLIGGIGKLGGIADDVLLAKAKGIGNAIGRMAATGAIKIGSEVLEEELQEFIQPALRTLIFDEEYKGPEFEDLAYTAILTALTTGLMEGGNIVSAGAQTANTGNVQTTQNIPAEQSQAAAPPQNIPVEQNNRVLESLISNGVSADKAAEISGIVERIVNGDTTISNNDIIRAEIHKNRGVRATINELTGGNMDISQNLKPSEVKPIVRGIIDRMNTQENASDEIRTGNSNAGQEIDAGTGMDSTAGNAATERKIQPQNELDKTVKPEYSDNNETQEAIYGREESTDNRGRQDSGRVDSERYLRESGSESSESGGRNGRGNLGGAERAVIPENARKIMTDKGIPNVELSETTDRGAFSAALENAKAANPNGGMVDSQTPEGLQKSGARTYMRPDGMAGVAVEGDGNIVGVFKNPAYKVRAVDDLILTAIANGGNHLDCYSTYSPADLRTKYAKLGFEPVCYLEFNREYAPDGWNYEAWGEPDVVLWVHSGESVEQIADHMDGYHVPTQEEIHALPKFEDYDEAKAYQRQKVQEKKSEAERTQRTMDAFRPKQETNMNSAVDEETPLQKALGDDTVDALNERIDRALQMQREGRPGSEIFSETGLISMGGLLADGFDGPVVWRRSNAQENGQRHSNVADEQTQPGMAGGEEAAESRSVSTENVGYDRLGADSQDEIARVINDAIGESTNSELDDVLGEYMDDGMEYDDIVRTLAKNIYDDYLESPVIAERNWGRIFDVSSMFARFDEVGQAAQRTAKTMDAFRPKQAEPEAPRSVTPEEARRDKLMQDTVRRMMGIEAQPTSTGEDVGVGAAEAGFSERETPGYAPTQSKGVTDSSWMDEQTREQAAPADHQVISERQSITNAMQGIDLDENGNIANYNEAVDNLMNLDKWSGSDGDAAMILMRAASKRGDWETLRSLAARYNALGTEAGQALQARKKWVKESPEDRLVGIVRAVNRLAQDHKARKGMEIKISDDLLAEYQHAQTEAERDKVVSKMQKQVADTIQPTLMDKWTALRYVNMLGNFKTQGRNVLGNIAMKGLYFVENEFATLSEAIAYKAGKGKTGRTKSAFVGREWMQAAKADYANVENEILNGGKYNDRTYEDDFTEGVEDERHIFGKYNPMEYYRRATNWAMERGDAIFCKSAYARAISGYLKANGITAEQFDAGNVNEALLNKAREYAIRRAQEQTFRDSNTFSEWAVRSLRGDKTPKLLRVAGEGMLPFRKTPANVLVRAVEFSPLGVVDTAVKAAQVAKGSEDITGNDVVDALSKTLTGSGLLVIGWILSDLGLLKGGSGEDDERIDELMNEQQWSLNIPGIGSYTLDWAAPASLIMFTGANLQELASDNGLTLKDFEAALTSLTEPMIEMSMLSGINDTLDSIKYSDNNLIQMASTLAVGYLSQGLTNTLLGQVERTIEDARMSTYVDSESDLPDWLQRSIGKASAKTPAWDYNQREYLDEFGNTEANGPVWQRVLENFISPGYYDAGNEGKPAYDFAKWAHENLGIDAFPQAYVDGTLTYNNQKLTLTQAEKDRYQVTRGSLAEEYLKAAAANDAFYTLSQDTQKEVLSQLMSRANGVAKSEMLEGRSLAERVSATEQAVRGLSAGQAVSYTNYIVAFNSLADADETDGAEAKALDALMANFNDLDEEVRKVLLENDSFAKFRDASEVGMSSQTYFYIKRAMRDADIPDGYVSQPAWHKNEVIMGMDISDEDKLTAIIQNHSGSSIADKIQTAYDKDIPLEDIVAYYALCQVKGEDGKSLSKVQRRIEANKRGLKNFDALERIFQ